MDKICWWCNERLATTGEHIFKKTDVERVYGKKNLGTIMYYDTKKYNVQGSNSNILKFRKSLCEECNTSRSSQMDNAYDNFIRAVRPKYDKFIRRLDDNIFCSFEDESMQINILKYFIKHVCCHLDYVNITPSKDLIEFLDTEKLPTSINCYFEMRPTNKFLSETSVDNYGKYYETMNVGKLSNGEINGKAHYFSWYTIDWISFNWVVSDVNANLELGKLSKLKIGGVDPPKISSKMNFKEQQDLLEEYDRILNTEVEAQFLLKLINN